MIVGVGLVWKRHGAIQDNMFVCWLVGWLVCLFVAFPSKTAVMPARADLNQQCQATGMWKAMELSSRAYLQA